MTSKISRLEKNLRDTEKQLDRATASNQQLRNEIDILRSTYNKNSNNAGRLEDMLTEERVAHEEVI